MADDPPQRHPASPITLLLQTLGMTRDDLSRHSTQMRNFLEAESEGFQPVAYKTELAEGLLVERNGVRSRTQSLTNLSLAGPSSYAASPPRTPVKAEPVERGIPSRPKDTMEMVMERKSKEKRRARKESMSRSRETREERVETHPTLTTPSRRSGSQNFETPHHYRYYSERVIGDATPKGETSASESPTKGRTHYRPPKTPTRTLRDSPRIPSPMSSPAVVNMVSSPGPMRSEAEAEAESDELPFTLPPGPYSNAKPDACYAAIIGQAILSSPQHRLTLQDIYEWITIVYPHYKRGEQTWMNSVRHALSTMAVFRKVPRQRQEGKSLWAVWDCDVACFANGDFKKSLCADMVKAKPEPSKGGPKRRGAEQTSGGRTSKRRRKDQDEAIGQSIPPMLPAPILPPFYSANIVPGTHHQPYYQTQPTFVPQPVPAEVIFPPLPPSSSFHHVRAASSRPLSRATSSTSVGSEGEDTSSSAAWSTAPPLSSDSSVPELTHDIGSSSSPQLSQDNLPTDDALEESSQNVEEDTKVGKDDTPTIVDPEDEFERWLASDTEFNLINTPLSSRKLFSRSASSSAGKAARQILEFFQVPDSPTLHRKSAKKVQKQATASSSSASLSQTTHRSSSETPSTPPPRPRTPPRRSSNTLLELSPQHTPLSHRGLHMSPSTSLAHYKTNLDPPPPPLFHSQAPLLFSSNPEGDSSSLPLNSPDLLRTPRRREKQAAGPSSATPSSASRFFGSIFGPPVTPKRLTFGSGDGSPLRTPSRSILDPHDPSALLDEELARLGSQSGSGHTPTGLFGNMRGMLYESPGLTSPGRWDRYW